MKIIMYSMVFLSIMGFLSCSLNIESLPIPDWTESTHGDIMAPDYDRVFAGDVVRRLDLVIRPDDWRVMWDDMTENYGAFGAGDGGGPGGGGGPGPGGVGPAGGENPVFVPCSVFFQNRQWYKVGVRFKGNSSLRHSWTNGNLKMGLKLDFDEFEADYPDIAGQRFYGFRQLSLAGNFSDPSFLKERVVPEIFRAAGVRAPYTAFYRVFIDHGDGPVYFGLYTMVEVVDDTFLENQFGSRTGNCYKPEGSGASFADGSFNPGDFVKKTNEDVGDWSDVIALFDALHSGGRTGAPGQWRNRLEAVFNVDGFLKWLAVNTVIQNWDTYGVMYHNYYLYNDPSGPGLTWIPWDNNEALYEGKRGGAVPLDFSTVDRNWPLIRFLADDETYRGRYNAYVAEVIADAFEPDKMIARYRMLHELIRPYVIGIDGENPGYGFLSSPAAFDEELESLTAHVIRRRAEAESYLMQQ